MCDTGIEINAAEFTSRLDTTKKQVTPTHKYSEESISCQLLTLYRRHCNLLIVTVYRVLTGTYEEIISVLPSPGVQVCKYLGR